MKAIFSVLLILLLTACANQKSVEYSPEFSFANYSYVVLERGKSSGVYGLDLKLIAAFANNQLPVVGDKEVSNLPYADQKRTLSVQLNVDGNDERVLLGLSLQNFLNGRTIATIGLAAKGDLFDKTDRNKAFAQLLEELTIAIRKDRQQAPALGASVSPVAKPSPVAPPTAQNPQPEYRPYILKPDFSD